MKISHGQAAKAAQAYLHETTRTRTTAGDVPHVERGRDQVSFSRTATEMRGWTSRVASLPESDRSAQIEALAQQVHHGAYHPSADRVADQILARSLAARVGSDPTG